MYAIAPKISQSFRERRRSSARRRYQENLTNYLNGILKMSKATNIKNGNVNIKCEYCGGCGYHKMSCPTQKVTVFIPTLEGDEAEEFIRKADENVRLMRQRLCKNHVWRKDYLNGGKKCQVCGKEKEEVERSKDVEE